MQLTHLCECIHDSDMKLFVNHCETRIFFALILVICSFSDQTEAIESLELVVQHDSSYSDAFSITNINYQLVGGRVIEFSCDVIVREPLTHGTKILVNVSPGFPYAGIVDNMDFDLCFVARKDMFLFRQLMSASNIPNTCPINPAVYSIRDFRLDLSRYPLALRGFDVVATFQVHNEDRIISKFSAKCVLK